MPPLRRDEPKPRAIPIAAVLGAAAVAAAALIAASLAGGASSEAPVAAAAPLAGVAETAELLRGIPQDGIALGSPDAPVTLVEYADLQCPYCAIWARDAFPTLVEEYVRPGRVRIEFRGLAFVGPESETALRTAQAAGLQGRLWGVVHLLYANQGPENGGWVSDELLTRIGASVPALDGVRMLAERDSAGVSAELDAAARAARAAGINATPSFQAGPTGGTMAPLQVDSLGPDGLRQQLDRLLAG
jgi:protein-disulfide isomerase